MLGENAMKALVFDIYGDYAHFKKFYTTASPLTFSIPPITSVRGMLGAIIGIDKNQYNDIFSNDQCNIGIRINKPIKKIRTGINYVNSKNNKFRGEGGHTPTIIELLKDVSYRLYVTHNKDDIYNELKSFLQKGHTFYTLSLGLSEFIASYSFIGEEMVRLLPLEKYDVDSIIPLDLIEDKKILFDSNKVYIREKIPTIMTTDREILKYDNIIYEENGGAIKAYVNNCYDVGGEKVVFI
jgi:CRISPR-associated protein Cas5h